jgi:hypothetical protein
LFIVALKESIASWVYIRTQFDSHEKTNEINFTYHTLPKTTVEDVTSNMGLVERDILNFVTSCALQDKWGEVDKFIDSIALDPEVHIRADLISIIKGNDTNVTDAITNNAKIILRIRHSLNITRSGAVTRVFGFTLLAVQVGIDLGKSNIISRLAFELLKRKWLILWERQRALLINPEQHFAKINKAFSVKSYSWPENVLCLMKAILPTLGVGDEVEVTRTLDELLIKVRT